MATFFIRFDVIESWKATFTADTFEEAEALVKQLEADEISTKDLDNFVDKNIGIGIEVFKDSFIQLPDFLKEEN